MADNLRLRVVMEMAERVLAPLRHITASSAAAAQALKTARDRLKELNAQQKMVGEFRQLKQGLQETSAKLAEAQNKVAQLARAHRAAGPPVLDESVRAAHGLGGESTDADGQAQGAGTAPARAALPRPWTGFNNCTARITFELSELAFGPGRPDFSEWARSEYVPPLRAKPLPQFPRDWE